MKFLLRLLVDLSVVLAFLHLTLLPLFVEPNQQEYLPIYAYCYLFLYFVLRVLEGWLARRGLEKRLREAEAAIDAKLPPIEVDETYEPMNEEAEALIAAEKQAETGAAKEELPKTEPKADPKPAPAAPPPWSLSAKPEAEVKKAEEKPGIEKALQPAGEKDDAKQDGEKPEAQPEKGA
jgi:hypothetical protein